MLGVATGAAGAGITTGVEGVSTGLIAGVDWGGGAAVGGVIDTGFATSVGCGGGAVTGGAPDGVAAGITGAEVRSCLTGDGVP